MNFKSDVIVSGLERLIKNDGPLPGFVGDAFANHFAVCRQRNDGTGVGASGNHRFACRFNTHDVKARPFKRAFGRRFCRFGLCVRAGLPWLLGLVGGYGRNLRIRTVGCFRRLCGRRRCFGSFLRRHSCGIAVNVASRQRHKCDRHCKDQSPDHCLLIHCLPAKRLARVSNRCQSRIR